MMIDTGNKNILEFKNNEGEKRLFLTSVLAVMAACPAFADPVIGPNQNEADCSSPTIGDAQPGDTVTYVADWGANHYKVVYAPGAHAASGVTSYEDEYDATNAPNAWHLAPIFFDGRFFCKTALFLC